MGKIHPSHFILIIYLLSTYILSGLAQKKENKPDQWKLVWADEFNTDGKPDSLSWSYEYGFVRNKELQWYQEKNAYCSGGKLVIEGRYEKVHNPNFLTQSKDWRNNRESSSYTSACLITKGKHQWKFGRFEICAKIDTSIGLWPAIWTLGIENEWPENGEIDLMEFYRIDQIPHILANTAWGTDKKWVAKWNSTRISLDKISKGDKDWCFRYHIWRMDWDSTKIDIFLDNELLNHTSLTDTRNANGGNPFLQPHYLLLNLAIGENGGIPDPTRFPLKYSIDYVRVYQRDNQ